MINIAPGEQVLKTVRKHWFFVALKMGSLGLLLLAPFLILAILSVVGEEHSAIATFLTEQRSTINFIIVLWFLFVWYRLFHLWTDFYLDKWVITDRRIIDIEQKGFFVREVSNFRIDRIQDVTTSMNGLLETFLNFGDIKVQTAGDNGDFTIPDIPRPMDLKEFISRLQEASKHNAPLL